MFVNIPGQSCVEAAVHCDRVGSLFLILEHEVRLPLESTHRGQALIG